jgi:malate dehydrogenase (oxaloacetate-decarboxylating)(NADP+)
MAREQGICEPILLGDAGKLKALIAEHDLEALRDATLVDPVHSPKSAEYAAELFKKRSRKGLTRMAAQELITENHHFAAMMLERGEADAYCSGVHHNYADAIRPALQIVGTKPDMVLAGVYMLVWRDKSLFFADTTVNINPTAEELAQIAIQTHDTAKIYLNEVPRVAMISFSNFGSNKHEYADKVRRATELVKEIRPDIEIDGEMQADTAVSPEVLQRSFPFSSLKGAANVLVFPDLTSGNVAYKLLAKLGGATLIGPILMGMKRPVNVLQRNSDVEEILNLVTFTAHRAQQDL